MNRYGTLKRFCIVWLLYWTIYLIQPVHSIYPAVGMAWSIQFLFFVVVCFTYAIASGLVPAHNNSSHTHVMLFDVVEANYIIRWGLVISFVGLLFLLYDKVFIQGIDYSQGLAEAREQWRLLGVKRGGGVSSIFSALGYALGGTYFLSLALTFSRFVYLSDSRRLFYLLSGWGLLISHSLATGGRSSILLAIAFVCFGYFSSKHDGLPPLFRRSIFRKIMWMGAVIMSAYVLYVFYARAVSMKIEVTTYCMDALGFLGLAPEAWFIQEVDASSFGGIVALLNLAVSYLTHSFATTAAIAEYTGENVNAIFVYLFSLGAKLGVLEILPEWFLSGRFPSLPGALYLQFGLFGVLAGAGSIGFLAGMLSSLFVQRRYSITLFFMCAVVESILLMSPFLFVIDFLFFPFLVFGGVILIVFSRLRMRYRV